HASQRIYDGPAADWDGQWTLVALPRLGNNGLAERTELRRELAWEGFGMLAPGLFAHPQAGAGTAHEMLQQLGIPDKALVLSGRDLAEAGGLPIASLAPHCWNLDELAGQYRHFSRQFAPLDKLLDEPVAPADAFAARMLLLHTWRRIVLHDPQLPVPMLPERRPGHAARALCGQIYWKLFDASEQHLDAVAGRDNDRYTALSPEVYARFGGRPGAQDPLGLDGHAEGIEVQLAGGVAARAGRLQAARPPDERQGPARPQRASQRPAAIGVHAAGHVQGQHR